MAQVKGKNTKRKSVSPKAKNEPIVENVIINEVDDNTTVIIDDEPEVQVVNEKNEIIYDPEAEIEKVYEKLGLDNTVELNDISKKAIDEIKNASKVIENSNPENENFKNNDDINSALDSLSEIEKQLEEDINKISSTLTNEQKKTMSKFDFTSFWSGISDGWNN